ncbi:flagellar hook basal-body protein [Sphingomonas gilva]|uniref:Flagellar hook basal-body protein n=1 Tax=Sphingomonas gilva TaxID=2305907 RepID=A0A396RRF3_9SPHN|nr:flagellar hook basal-body protein [Sphingomonas gilva]RHW18969.1 flagellar hook basal-body protein [Sphingomonas gilva]
MSGLVESATAIMSASERRLEIVSQNISNASTPGYKRVQGFADVLAIRTAEPASLVSRTDMAQGTMRSTGNPLDLAISGAGFFLLRDGDALVYSRQGQFRRAEDGNVVNAQGHVLQQAGGGDLQLATAAVEIVEDGTVLDGGRPIARLALFAVRDGMEIESAGGSRFTAAEGVMEDAPAAIVRQGMLESSNVEMSQEMVTMMAAMRSAETGSRLVQIYDDLIGRAITNFGGGR